MKKKIIVEHMYHYSKNCWTTCILFYIHAMSYNNMLYSLNGIFLLQDCIIYFHDVLPTLITWPRFLKIFQTYVFHFLKIRLALRWHTEWNRRLSWNHITSSSFLGLNCQLVQYRVHFTTAPLTLIVQNFGKVSFK
jgi:hypothetical protein